RRPGVGREMRPVRVQQRSEKDAPQAVGLQRTDAVEVPLVAAELVEQLNEVEQRHEADDRGSADDPRGALLRLGRRVGHAHSFPCKASSASSKLPAYWRWTGTSIRRRPPR